VICSIYIFFIFFHQFQALREFCLPCISTISNRMGFPCKW
jgi:hypothetical protein